MKNLSSAEKAELRSRLRRKNEDFGDVYNRRAAIVRMIDYQDAVKIELVSELEMWDTMLEDMFNKEIEKEIAMKIKK